MRMTDLFLIEGPWPGRLAISPRPRGGDWLRDELAGWKSAGIGLVVSALTPAEMEELELTEEPSLCEELGIGFANLPIEDRGVPDVRTARPRFEEWRAELAGGRSLVVHCRQGIGRSSLVAASLLTLEAQPDAWDRVETARGRTVPDTDEQRDWIERLRGDRNPV